MAIRNEPLAIPHESRSRGQRRGSLRSLIGLELFKLIRRPLPRLLLLIMFGLATIMPFLIFVVLRFSPEPRDAEAAAARQDLAERLAFPTNLPILAATAMTFGLPLLVVLTATSFGGEFAWGTVRLLLARGVGRGQYVLAKGIAIALWWGLALVVGAAGGIGAAALAGAFEGLPGVGAARQSDLNVFATRLAVSWLAALVYIGLTAAVTMQLRSTALGLAIGLASVFGEGIVVNIANSVGFAPLDWLARAGINHNLGVVVNLGEGSETPVYLSAVILALYTAMTTAGAIRNLRRRDVVIAGVG